MADRRSRYKRPGHPISFTRNTHLFRLNFGGFPEAVFSERIQANPRWSKGEVDLEPGTQRPRFGIEVKWSDRAVDNPKLLRPLAIFAKRHKLSRIPPATTCSYAGRTDVDNVEIELSPTD